MCIIHQTYTRRGLFMRTNIDIDDTILQAAMQAGGFKTKKETVEAGLRMLRSAQIGLRQADESRRQSRLGRKL